MAIGRYVIGLSFSYVSMWDAQAADRVARYMVYLGARGGFLAMLHRT